MKKSDEPRVDGCEPIFATVSVDAIPVVDGAPAVEAGRDPGWATAQVEASTSGASTMAVEGFIAVLSFFDA